MKMRHMAVCLALLLTFASAPALASRRRPVTQKMLKVKVYLVKIGEAGKGGKKIGCDDSLVAVTRTIKATIAPLKAAIEELLSIPHDEGNYWMGTNLKVKSASISKGTATIRITGEGPSVAGICDEPRITSQIEETAKQFPSVKRVKVYVNGRPLAEVIR